MKGYTLEALLMMMMLWLDYKTPCASLQIHRSNNPWFSTSPVWQQEYIFPICCFQDNEATRHTNIGMIS